MLPSLKKEIILFLERAVKERFAALRRSNISYIIELDIPKESKHGDFSCNIALRLAGLFKRDPIEIATLICDFVQKEIEVTLMREKVERVEVKNPGFINFFLREEAVYSVLEEVFKERQNYGRCNMGEKMKVQIEFVSANPTGPLSVAHARQAAVGDALANILNFVGFDVKKEYYVNDEGNQINILGRSIICRMKEILGEGGDFPEDGYQGQYIYDIAKRFMEENNIQGGGDLQEKESQIAQYGVDYLLRVIKEDLKDFGVEFDVWAYQSKIAPVANIESMLAFLQEKGFIYEHEGALWFKSSELGDDKDRVVKKSDGTFTYLTPDIVYHKDKFERGFENLINIWGPDHHGYVPRIKAAVKALGRDSKDLKVLIIQLATIFKDGKPISMSTRRGEYISLREVINEVGVDAARFFFLMRHIQVHLDFDLELAKKETAENPVYYVQYAHARINSINIKADGLGIKPKEVDFELLKEKEEMDLMKKIGEFSDALVACYNQLDPFALVSYLQELATCFHKFYDLHRVIDQDELLASERLALIDATRIVLANGLRLLGVSAPEKM